ncbi:MAG: hypothetical protein IT462_10735 [Planctomycetes bacterium]|nr:hypothetical protein [Planctomycetota bacterium]
MARTSDGRKSITFFLGIFNIVVALVWGALYILTLEVARSFASPSSMLLYVATFFMVAMGGVIVPNLEKDSGKSGRGTGMLLSWLAALLYGGYAALHYTNYYEVVRRAIFPNG